MKSSPPFKNIFFEFKENMKYDKTFYSMLVFYTVMTAVLNRVNYFCVSKIADQYSVEIAEWSISLMDVIIGL